MFAFSTNALRYPLIWWRRYAPSLARSRMLPLGEPWSALVPAGGLRRGSTVVVQAPPGSGALSLALSLLTEASAKGHWAGVVGVDDPGVVAIAELGVDLRRVLFVPRPGPAWAESAADLLDGVDLLVVRPPSRASSRDRASLMDRVRERGTVLDRPRRAELPVAPARRPLLHHHPVAVGHVDAPRRALSHGARGWPRRGGAHQRALRGAAEPKRTSGGA
jgi:hypothetical protein